MDLRKYVLATCALVFLTAAVGCTAEQSGTEPADPLAMPPLPSSAFVDSSRVLARGAADSVFAWAGPSTRGMLTTIRGVTPPSGTYLSLDVLIKNSSSQPLLLSPRAAFLRHATGVQAPFKGQQWPMPADSLRYYWLGPRVFEINGKDASGMGIAEATIQPGDYAAFRVSFPVPDTLGMQTAAAGIKELIVPYVPHRRPAALLRLRGPRGSGAEASG